MTAQLHLHDLHERLGARFGEADGHLLPLHYGNVAAEYETVRERTGVIDRSQRGKIDAIGRDRATFLHGLVSNDVQGLAPGRGCPAAFLDVHGKILALLAVHCLPDRLRLETDRLLVPTTLATLDRFLFSERVEFGDVSATEGILTLAGPGARATVEKVLEQALPELGPLHHVRVSAEGLEVLVVRTEETGEEAYDLWSVPGGLRRFWEGALGAGARPVGREAWNILRVEAGVVWHGVDVDAGTLVMEAPLEHAYSLTKGCYVGQEVIARVTYRGHVNRKIVGLRFPDARIPAPGAGIVVDGREVGRITSVAVSPARGRGLALGFLRREHWGPGATVAVSAADGLLTAEVAALPFFRRTPDGVVDGR